MQGGNSRLRATRCSSFTCVGCANAPAATAPSSVASSWHTYGAPKQYPTQATLVFSSPYFSRAATAHLTAFSAAKVECLARQAARSKPSGSGSVEDARYFERGS